jgi:hypothetical protein
VGSDEPARIRAPRTVRELSGLEGNREQDLIEFFEFGQTFERTRIIKMLERQMHSLPGVPVIEITVYGNVIRSIKERGEPAPAPADTERRAALAEVARDGATETAPAGVPKLKRLAEMDDTNLNHPTTDHIREMFTIGSGGGIAFHGKSLARGKEIFEEFESGLASHDQEVAATAVAQMNETNLEGKLP